MTSPDYIYKFIKSFMVIIPIYIMLGAIGFYFIEFSKIGNDATDLQSFKNQVKAIVKCLEDGM